MFELRGSMCGAPAKLHFCRLHARLQRACEKRIPRKTNTSERKREMMRGGSLFPIGMQNLGGARALHIGGARAHHLGGNESQFRGRSGEADRSSKCTGCSVEYVCAYVLRCMQTTSSSNMAGRGYSTGRTHSLLHHTGISLRPTANHRPGW